mmetsp:Transcript_17724/g.46746  ORF Transcript_17724/g.46746 Transcript_17724/m.46746 type:complete len:436 (+) Transcript_17724:49-1356(+)
MAQNHASKAMVKNPTSEVCKVTQEGDVESTQESFLPRCSPFVGFLTHAPHRQSRSGQLDAMLRRRRSRRFTKEQEKAYSSGEENVVGDSDQPAAPPDSLRRIPYVGYRRHAPPSPMLSFKPASSSSCVLRKGFSIDELDELEPQEGARLPGGLPEELWLLILSDVIDVPALNCLTRITTRFADLVRSEEVWRGREVRISPKSLEPLALKLGAWLPAWQSASRLVVPNSQQLLAEIARLAPNLRVDVAWRFNTHQRGAGVDIVDYGLTARRVADKELVVLGDAPLICSPSGQYLEVRLDERGEDLPEDEGGCVNDFGLGVTACDPEELDALGAVAVEVPRSWVVDFTKTGVSLSVNDELAAKGTNLTANELQQGDRVGLRITPGGCMEVYINGRMRQLLTPPEAERVPQGARLFPVLDLCGPSVQISRTDNIELVL